MARLVSRRPRGINMWGLITCLRSLHWVCRIPAGEGLWRRQPLWCVQWLIAGWGLRALPPAGVILVGRVNYWYPEPGPCCQPNKLTFIQMVRHALMQISIISVTSLCLWLDIQASHNFGHIFSCIYFSLWQFSTLQTDTEDIKYVSEMYVIKQQMKHVK